VTVTAISQTKFGLKLSALVTLS